jgi:hypothetical protein
VSTAGKPSRACCRKAAASASEFLLNRGTAPVTPLPRSHRGKRRPSRAGTASLPVEAGVSAGCSPVAVAAVAVAAVAEADASSAAAQWPFAGAG